jgi:hypothetical protein
MLVSYGAATRPTSDKIFHPTLDLRTIALNWRTFYEATKDAKARHKKTHKVHRSLWDLLLEEILAFRQPFVVLAIFPATKQQRCVKDEAPYEHENEGSVGEVDLRWLQEDRRVVIPKAAKLLVHCPCECRQVCTPADDMCCK